MMTIETIKYLQTVLKVEVDGQLGPITRKAIADKLIDIAKKEIGVHETSANRGEGIEKYWTATTYPEGYKDRQPYCATFISWCFKQSGIFSEKNRPKTPGAFAYEQWARELGITVIKSPDSIKRGDLVIYNYSHIELAISDSDKYDYFITIGANTSPNSAGNQRNGDGVYQRTRSIGRVRSVVRF